MENEVKQLDLISKNAIYGMSGVVKGAVEFIISIHERISDEALFDKVQNNTTKLMDEIISEANATKRASLERAYIETANLEIIKNYFNDERFNEANKKEFKNIVVNDLDTENMVGIFRIYQKKKTLANTENMTYAEIMALEWDEDFEEYQKDMDLFTKILKGTRNIWLWGSKGNGKSTFARNIAKKLGCTIYKINSVKNEWSLKGNYDINGTYHESEFEKWWCNDNSLLDLEEADSFSTNGTIYLNDALEIGTDEIVFGDGTRHKRGKNLYVIATANTDGSGKTQEYLGRNAQDGAFLDRFTPIEFREYAYVHKQILGDKDLYEKVKNFYHARDKELSCRLCKKIKCLMEQLKIEEILELVDSGRIKL